RLRRLPLRAPPGYPLFPYTTLFRSWDCEWPPAWASVGQCWRPAVPAESVTTRTRRRSRMTTTTRYSTRDCGVCWPARSWCAVGRSEEHTSELQSRFDLVCRLLLDKK